MKYIKKFLIKFYLRKFKFYILAKDNEKNPKKYVMDFVCSNRDCQKQITVIWYKIKEIRKLYKSRFVCKYCSKYQF